MNNNIWWIIIIAFIIIDILIVVVVFRTRKKKNKKIFQLIQKKWCLVETIQNPNLQVLEAEKVVDYLFTVQGYKGSFADKLKSFQRRTKYNMEYLWYAHKVRNAVAHEIGMVLTESERKKVVLNFKKALYDLGMKW